MSKVEAALNETGPSYHHLQLLMLSTLYNALNDKASYVRKKNRGRDE